MTEVLVSPQTHSTILYRIFSSKDVNYPQRMSSVFFGIVAALSLQYSLSGHIFNLNSLIIGYAAGTHCCQLMKDRPLYSEGLWNNRANEAYVQYTVVMMSLLLKVYRYSLLSWAFCMYAWEKRHIIWVLGITCLFWIDCVMLHSNWKEPPVFMCFFLSLQDA